MKKEVDEYKWHIEWRDPNTLRPYERNAKVHTDDQVEWIANSIKEFGWQQPGVITKDGVMVVGHGRRLAAIKLGVKMPVKVIEDDMTEDEIRAYRQVDNKTNESPWDEELATLDRLDIELDLTKFGFADELSEEQESEQKKDQREKTVEAMQIKQFEHHDYIVFVFDNQFDWLNICDRFGLEKVDAGYGKTKKIGLGRVIDGKRLLEALEHQDSDTEPGAV